MSPFHFNVYQHAVEDTSRQYGRVRDVGLQKQQCKQMRTCWRARQVSEEEDGVVDE